MKRTILEKIWNAHSIPADAGDQSPEILAIDPMLMHEVASAQGFALLKERTISLFDRSRLVATLDLVDLLPTSRGTEPRIRWRRSSLLRCFFAFRSAGLRKLMRSI